MYLTPGQRVTEGKPLAAIAEGTRGGRSAGGDSFSGIGMGGFAAGFDSRLVGGVGFADASRSSPAWPNGSATASAPAAMAAGPKSPLTRLLGSGVGPSFGAAPPSSRTSGVAGGGEAAGADADADIGLTVVPSSGGEDDWGSWGGGSASLAGGNPSFGRSAGLTSTFAGEDGSGGGGGDGATATASADRFRVITPSQEQLEAMMASSLGRDGGGSAAGAVAGMPSRHGVGHSHSVAAVLGGGGGGGSGGSGGGDGSRQQRAHWQAAPDGGAGGVPDWAKGDVQD
ncbi:unnamed protein product [Phaeothamnion confervicola]